MKHKLLVLFLLLLSISMLWGAGNSESVDASYPTKPITMIVPYGAGGTTDISGRQLAVQLEKHLGKSITVINQGGASGSIGARTVLDAKSDGYTVLFTAESLGTQRVMGLSEMSYDDFTPIMVAVNDPKVIVVGKDSAYETLQDLVDDIKNRPGKVKMSYTGPGGSGHVQAMIYGKFGMEMALTAYPGGADCILAVLGDQVDFTNSNYSTVTGYLESGDLKLLGISALDRLEAHPDVPTLGEILPGSERYLSNPFTPLSLLVDKDVPPEVVTILRDAAKKAVQEPAWKEFVVKNSLDKLYEKYPDESSMRKFYKDWESLVSWMLYDSGVAKFSPAKFGIEKSQY
ncbi:MAG: hypothetical protein PWP25_362 [Sphaerochaeta sp.]|jgi:tripartite-type tricarboxylate transporter receptor subunit TctC|uniref:Tripartite tricarboxylate transporter substrate binding protein n=1 Tax=Sphaerochaeta halotolerans TaxID=2293840 RepID=A0A372MFS5_9SPIR|nr:tripartite tricarboxylate transporter substrate binding protein [Sphaerochaeta halotolerans]MBG0766191.1 tripartite tricarboxylate transporter substrate binding protein [Spirochaetaceae bacterium]MDK2859176.1 hypothetical protein [Sphaerochaeta sp.]MDN5333417.1 hypothetical protein [Sphaerochaeta sp.]RFU94649.1 tripartite tricarboxylate transporter substrate binding protein [Sphaerochaeta halotolerans]